MQSNRFVSWVRWFGWTAVFALVAWFSGLAYVRLQGMPTALDLLFLVPPLAAAFLIGTRFPSWWWPAGPLVMMFLMSLAGTPLLLILYLLPAPLLPGWMSSAEAMTLALLAVVILVVLHALAAAAGVRRGQRREH